jgi:alkylation response protein AidB-like acyl-CoA dehydrogenase
MKWNRRVEYRQTPNEAAFREEVREWLRANKPRTSRPGEDDHAGQKAYDLAWQRTQFDGGWAGIAWPKQYGGRGLSPIQQLIWCEEYAVSGCPSVQDSSWLGLNHAAPILMAHGTEEQKAFHLPKILKGEANWCQGFSEPNAGSDLPALRTRGELDGDHLVVNGQKIWTTNAHHADYQELLVRTGPPGGRHRGLTWIICDLRTQGVVVRPIRALDGKVHNSEVFYTDVRIPLANVVGEIDEGWAVAVDTLNNERGAASFNNFYGLSAAFETLIAEADRDIATDDAALAERIGVIRARVQSLRALVLLMASAQEERVDLGAEGLIMHLPFGELLQDAGALALDLRGADKLSRRASSELLGLYFLGFAATIAGGTAEIQRNLIGERLLGLPR